jgi:hypothetical protein
MEPTAIPPAPAEPGAASEEETVEELLGEVAPEHPALRRLAQRHAAGRSLEATITSYDRMHHRHNRS